MSKRRPHIGGFVRISLVALFVIAQLLLLLFLVMQLRSLSIYLFLFLELAGLLEAIILIDEEVAISYKIAWTIIILLLPVFGWVLFLLWGKASTHGKKSQRIRAMVHQTQDKIWSIHPAGSVCSQVPERRRRIASYLENQGFPVHVNTDCQYYELGESLFQALLKDLRQARRFIFVEFFIVSDGRLWQEVYQILKEKASAGVEVRFMYDDMGSLFNLPQPLRMPVTSDHQIKVAAFNPVHHHIARFYLNYRNHRKTVIIDGNIGYTGGVNLADEYANYYERYGHWKDTGIRLEGDAVWSMTVGFLQLWIAENIDQPDKHISWQAYRPDRNQGSIQDKHQGFFQPFSDGPANNPSNPAEDLYRQMIGQARRYIYISTPYLVIDDAMMNDLCIAAQSSLDVRIITPKVPDRWFVHIVTRSNYGRLLKYGVKIYEYTPGYIHAKTILSDDDHAVTGSINMDYRSFHLHFESGVWIAGAPVLKEIKEDFRKTFAISEPIDHHAWLRRSWFIKPVQTFLRLFSPLM